MSDLNESTERTLENGQEGSYLNKAEVDEQFSKYRTISQAVEAGECPPEVLTFLAGWASGRLG